VKDPATGFPSEEIGHGIRCVSEVCVSQVFRIPGWRGAFVSGTSDEEHWLRNSVDDFLATIHISIQDEISDGFTSAERWRAGVN
jgi:hypothetical protein